VAYSRRGMPRHSGASALVLQPPLHVVTPDEGGATNAVGRYALLSNQPVGCGSTDLQPFPQFGEGELLIWLVATSTRWSITANLFCAQCTQQFLLHLEDSCPDASYGLQQIS
jgi:hypothetical protein